MANLKTCERSAAGNVITPRVRLAYADGLKKAQLPQGEKDPEKARFQVTGLAPNDVDLKMLNEEVEKTAVEKWGADYKKKYKVKKPFLKTEEYPKVGVEATDFPVMFRCSSPTRPQIVDAAGKAVGEDQHDRIYSGRWGRISLRCYAWDHPTGGKGVSFGLQNVQLLDDDEPLGGGRPRAEDEFTPAEGVDGEAGGSTDSLFE